MSIKVYTHRILWDDDTAITAYPNVVYRSDPTQHVVVVDELSEYYGHWREKIQYIGNSTMGRPLNFLLNVAKREDETKDYDLLTAMFNKSFDGTLLGIHPFTGEIYPDGDGGPVGNNYALLANDSQSIYRAASANFFSYEVASQESIIRSLRLVTTAWTVLVPSPSPRSFPSSILASLL